MKRISFLSFDFPSHSIFFRRLASSILQFSFLILLFVLVACASNVPPSAPTTSASATVSATASSTPIPPTATSTTTPTLTPTATPLPPNPLEISAMRARDYPGSEMVIEQTLAPGANYSQYIASYISDGYKIFGLLTIPNGPKPKTGFPLILFNHGYIPPTQYKTTERYVAYVDAIARAGYIVFKSDYRGHGNSEGNAAGGYGSPDYTVDVLNALASLKRNPDVDVNRIGIWGHSMGGQVTLRAMVVSKEFKAGVIWAGVVAPYADIATRWFRGTFSVTPTPTFFRGGWRNSLMRIYGSPEDNPEFWNSISPNSYLQDISGPLQLHHDLADHEVPYAMSQLLDEEMKAASKYVEFYSYPGDDHNIANNFGTAMTRSIQFFDKYVKNAP